MHVVHLLRKCDPDEWGGTETAVQRLFEGLRHHGVESVVHCPRLAPRPIRGTLSPQPAAIDPLTAAGCAVRRYRAFVPVWGLSRSTRQQHIAVGGNLMSFGLLRALWREPDVSVIHTHTLGRLGGIASTVARRRKIPFVVTIHGGLLDLPPALRQEFKASGRTGFDWGRIFGLLLQSRRLLEHADAILTCNAREAALLQQQNPRRRVQVQPHGVPSALFQADHRAAARAAFPEIGPGPVLLSVGRIDPVKNQGWLVEQAGNVFARHPQARIVFAGGCTDEPYRQTLVRQIRKAGFQDRVFMVGGFPPGDPRLIGLLQLADVVILPSLSETFGLVILEAWAAGRAVLASRTSGATSLIRHAENGWLFDLDQPSTFHEALGQALTLPALRTQLAAAGQHEVATQYDIVAVAGKVKRLYEQLIEANHALRHSPRR